MPVYKSVDKNFFKKWSPDMAYVLGFFAADGYMTFNKWGAGYWCIQITDGDLLREIKKIIKAEHKISFRKGRGNNKDKYRLQIGSLEMCKDLQELGYSERKTYSLSIPNIPAKYFHHFVRGYFDGDGHVWVGLLNKERINPHLVIQTVFTSCSKIFLELLGETLKSRNIYKGVVSKGKGNYYRLTYSILSSLKLHDFMYNDLGTSKLFLKRKKDVFEKFKKMRL